MQKFIKIKKLKINPFFISIPGFPLKIGIKAAIIIINIRIKEFNFNFFLISMILFDFFIII